MRRKKEKEEERETLVYIFEEIKCAHLWWLSVCLHIFSQIREAEATAVNRVNRVPQIRSVMPAKWKENTRSPNTDSEASHRHSKQVLVMRQKEAHCLPTFNDLIGCVVPFQSRVLPSRLLNAKYGLFWSAPHGWYVSSGSFSDHQHL